MNFMKKLVANMAWAAVKHKIKGVFNMKLARKMALLICSLIIAMAPWVAALPSWGAMFTPQNIAIGLPIAAGVVIAWLGTSPIKPKTL